MRTINETITLKDLHILLLSEEQSIKNIKDYSIRSKLETKPYKAPVLLSIQDPIYNRGCGRNNSNTVNQFLLRRQVHSWSIEANMPDLWWGKACNIGLLPLYGLFQPREAATRKVSCYSTLDTTCTTERFLNFWYWCHRSPDIRPRKHFFSKIF